MSTAFVFPGQGSQSIKMGKDFYDEFQIAKDTFHEVDDVLGRKLSDIIFSEDIKELSETINTQPALMCVSIAILRVLEQEIGAKASELCDFIAGHSLGEYSALCAGESISLATTTQLLNIRATAMQRAGNLNKGAMAALLGASIEDAEAIVAKCSNAKSGAICQVANDNCTGQIVISGSDRAIDEAEKMSKEMNIKRFIRLPVSGAFHSGLMELAQFEMEKALRDVEIGKPKMRFVPNVVAMEVYNAEEIRRLLLKQITGRVRWRETIIYLEEQGVNKIVEIGAGKVLSGLVGKTTKNIEVVSINNVESMREFIS